jgi:hypothetical protein
VGIFVKNMHRNASEVQKFFRFVGAKGFKNFYAQNEKGGEKISHVNHPSGIFSYPRPRNLLKLWKKIPKNCHYLY